MGAEAVRALLEELNLEELRVELRDESQSTKSQTKKKKLTKRLKVVEAFLESGNNRKCCCLATARLSTEQDSFTVLNCQIDMA